MNSRGYSKTYIPNEYGSQMYYIHRHVNHFQMGAAQARMKQIRDEQYGKMRKRYVQNYINSTSLTQDQQRLLSQAMEGKEGLVSEMDKILSESFASSANQKLAGKTLDMVTDSYKAIDNYLKDAEKDLRKLDTLFTQITNAIKLLNSSGGAELAMILKSNLRNANDITALRAATQDALKFFEGKVIRVNNKQIYSILQSLDRFVAALEGGSYSKPKLQGYLRNIFSTQLGEIIAGKAGSLAYKETRQLGKNISSKSSGTNTIRFEEDSELATHFKQFGSQSRVYKTDALLETPMTIVEGENEIKFEVGTGLSVKWYKSLKNTGQVGVVNEKSLEHRLEQMLNGNDKYLAYNAIALAGQDSSGYTALKSAILARNLDTFISGLGGGSKDFSQFLVINGEFYSIWDIINVVQNYNSGVGSTDEKTNDPFTISATGASKVIQLTQDAQNREANLIEAYTRSKKQNEIIKNNLGIKVNFHPNNLKNILKK